VAIKKGGFMRGKAERAEGEDRREGGRYTGRDTR
jgi:hypothetical protein